MRGRLKRPSADPLDAAIRDLSARKGEHRRELGARGWKQVNMLVYGSLGVNPFAAGVLASLFECVTGYGPRPAGARTRRPVSDEIWAPEWLIVLAESLSKHVTTARRRIVAQVMRDDERQKVILTSFALGGVAAVEVLYPLKGAALARERRRERAA